MFSVAVKNKRWVSPEFNNCMKTNAQKIKLCQIKKTGPKLEPVLLKYVVKN